MAEDLSDPWLPIEVLYHVMSYVEDRSTLQNLSLTSKALNKEANRKLWKHFKIHTQSFLPYIMECIYEKCFPLHPSDRTITYAQATSYERIDVPNTYTFDVFAEVQQSFFINSVSQSYSFMLGRIPSCPTKTNGISCTHIRLLIYSRISIRDFHGQHLLRLSSI